MSAIRKKMVEYINEMPEYKLATLKPLIELLVSDEVYVEKVNFNDLTDDEKQAILDGEEALRRGELVSLDDLD